MHRAQLLRLPEPLLLSWAGFRGGPGASSCPRCLPASQPEARREEGHRRRPARPRPPLAAPSGCGQAGGGGGRGSRPVPASYHGHHSPLSAPSHRVVMRPHEESPSGLAARLPPVPPRRRRLQKEREASALGALECLLLGDGAVGKTSLALSYSANGFPARYVPTALDRFSAVVQVDGAPLRLQLCDTAGQDEFDPLRRVCYPRADVILLCFSVVAPTSFQNIADKWYPEVRRCCPGTPVLLVGTQSDLREDVKVLIALSRRGEKPVRPAAAHALSAKLGTVAYMECSALTQQNVKEVFDAAITAGLRRAEPPGPKVRRRTASCLRTLSKDWWRKYVCVR
uniref:Rho-related GTP-binding protein RhoU-like n=1 Tax=Salvator merianae TaxID=96440 RepID=A0A8D0DGT6_SALMN